MRKKWLWIGIMFVALALIAAILWLTLPGKKDTAEAPQQRTTKVSKGNITVSVSGSGSVITTDSESIRTKDEGKVSKVHVKVGDTVKKGQALLTYEAEDFSDNLEDQETTLQTQKWDLEDLQDQYKQHVQAGASEEELKQIKKSIDKQELNIEKTEKNIASIKEDMLPPDPLTSPIAGTITAVNITSGEQTKAGTELFVITDYQNLSVKTQIDELDISKVQKGMKANIQLDALPDQTIEGEVNHISNEGTASNGVSLFDVTIKMNPTDSVRVGMSAEATIIVDEQQDILKLPIEAVQKIGEKYMVMLPSSTEDATKASDDSAVPSSPKGPSQSSAEASTEASTEIPARSTEGGRRGSSGKMTEVKVGVHDENDIQIVSGLNEGDEVIIPTIVKSANSNALQEQAIKGGEMRFGESGGAMSQGNLNRGSFPSSGGGMSRGGGQ
ncbi:efflux RND transporter periplasmic adaptor subunit [Paenibacillus aceti]|uniref:Hemolysin D n=1 Tax=Paenibacillus aceti TaxID=1820010 RepID=A0ABQ1W4S1_9BACL|nr:efflux RND transporter periplasmic adaptor subunit [Paenibacillus aceti]GGG14333.1 hemolysin D [Paenibacillus aceti]